MSKSLLYGVNRTLQTVVVGDRVNFGNIVRRYGCNINMTGGEVYISGEGYYNLDASVTVEAGAAGIVTVTLLRDGSIIPGAVVSQTVAVGDTVTLTVPPSVIREKCCGESTITAVISGVTGTISNATIRVVKE